MNVSSDQIRIRSVVLHDLQKIFSIDQAIRKAKISITYAGFSTKHILGLDKADTGAENRGILLEEVTKLLDLSIVAEYGGEVVGYIIGRQAYIFEYDTTIGEIAIIGVHPDCRYKGIATKMIDTISDIFRSKGVKSMLFKTDPRDTELKAFSERVGFVSDALVHFTRPL